MLFRRNTITQLVIVAFLCASVGFGYGALMVDENIFPYRMLKDFKDSFVELKRWKMYLQMRPTSHLHPTRRDGRGVVVNEGAAVQPGFTLVSGLFDNNGRSVRLIDSNGNIVKEWPVKYSTIWPNPKHLVDPPFSDWFVGIHGLILLPDNSIVFNFEYLGLSRVASCGNVLWTIPRETHHAVFLAEDNTIWVPARKHHQRYSSEFPNISPPFYEDTVLQISLDGTILREISILRLIYKNEMEGLLPTGIRSTRLTNPDPLHLNDVDILLSSQAAAFNSLHAGVVMVSMRTPNLILIFDPETEEILWHQTGPWLRQHDPDFRDDGLISIFDNRGVEDDEDVFGASRMLVTDPITRRTREAYPHGEENRFFTPTGGRHQNLENGNILLVENTGGRILEISKEGRIVWSYLNKYDENNVGTVQEAIRYPQSYLDGMPKTCGDPSSKPTHQ